MVKDVVVERDGGIKYHGEKHERGERFKIDDEDYPDAIEAGYVSPAKEKESRISEPEELGEPEEEKEGITEDMKRFLTNRGWSKNEEKNIWTKETKVDGKLVRLVRDFEKTGKGAKMAIDSETGESMKVLAEDYPDQKYFTKLRKGEIDLNEAVAKAESEANRYGKEGKNEELQDEAEELGEEISSETLQKQVQIGAQIEPAMELDETETTEKLDDKIVQGLTEEDLKALVWDPEENRKLPYDRPTASAEAYDLFARIVEMALGVSYSEEGEDAYVFRETENTYECDAKIIRKSENPMIPNKVMRGYKTRSKKATSGIDHWRERLQTKARRNALKKDIPKTWISRLLKKYRDERERMNRGR